MTTTIRFIVPGAPCAKAKKLGTINGHATSFNDTRTATYQNLVTLVAQGARFVEPLSGPLALLIVAVYPRLGAASSVAPSTSGAASVAGPSTGVSTSTVTGRGP